MNLQLRDHGSTLALVATLPDDYYGILFQNIPPEARPVLEYLLHSLEDVGEKFDQLILNAARVVIEKGYSEDELDALVDYAASLCVDSDSGLGENL